MSGTVSGCGWRRGHGASTTNHESIHARLLFAHSSTNDTAIQVELRRSDERQERAARNLAGAPIQQLAAFNRLAAVQPGESRTIELPITAQHLAFASRDGS
jgi:hypothetical protein